MGPVIEPYVTDHTFVDKDPILMARDAWSKDIDIIIGGTSNEGLLLLFFPDPEQKRINALKNLRNFTPFLELNMKVDDSRAEKIGQKLKEVYYGALTPSQGNMQGSFYYHGDSQFWHGIQRAIKSRLQTNGKGKTFTYRFDISTKQNIFRALMNASEFEGTEHGACVCYITFGRMFPQPAIDSVEFKNIKKMIGIIANFAIYGNHGIAEWEDNKSLELPLKCFNLTKDGDTFIDLPEADRLKVWDEIYRECGVELY